jgi:hypothetical protein
LIYLNYVCFYTLGELFLLLSGTIPDHMPKK